MINRARTSKTFTQSPTRSVSCKTSAAACKTWSPRSFGIQAKHDWRSLLKWGRRSRRFVADTRSQREADWILLRKITGDRSESLAFRESYFPEGTDVTGRQAAGLLSIGDQFDAIVRLARQYEGLLNSSWLCVPKTQTRAGRNRCKDNKQVHSGMF